MLHTESIERFKVVLEPDLVVRDSFGVLLDEFSSEQNRMIGFLGFSESKFCLAEQTGFMNLLRNLKFLPNLFVRNGPRLWPGYANELFIFRRDIYLNS